MKKMLLLLTLLFGISLTACSDFTNPVNSSSSALEGGNNENGGGNNENGGGNNENGDGNNENG